MAALLVTGVLSTGVVLTYVRPLLGMRAIPSDEWEVAFPWLFPTALVVLGGAGVATLTGLWPVYGLWSLPLLFVVAMGAFMALALVA